jgi:hypothetical protein
VTKVNWKKLLLTFMAVFVVLTVLGYVIHAVLLASDYQSVSHLFRRQPFMPFLLLGNASFSLAFVWIYAMGVEAKPWVKVAVFAPMPRVSVRTTTTVNPGFFIRIRTA